MLLKKELYIVKNQIKTGIILQYIQLVLTILITLIYTPVMLTILGQAEYGIYNLAVSIISYLSLLSLGFGSSYIRFYSRYKASDDKENIAKLNGLFLITFIIIGIISLISGLILCDNISFIMGSGLTNDELNLSRVLMLILTVNMTLSFPASVFNSYITSQERFIFQKSLLVIKTVSSPFLTLPLLLLGYGSIGMVLVTTGITFTIFIINIYYCLNKLKMKFDFHHLNFSLFKEIFIFSFYIAINQIVNQINWATDKIIIGRYIGSEAISVYTIGSTFNTMYISFSIAISGVFSPRINKLISEKKDYWNAKVNDLFIKVGRIQFYVLILILSGFIFFGKYFIGIWAGDGYEESYYVALLLMAPATIALIQNLGIEIQRAENKHQFRSITYLIMAIVNIGISVWLCQIFGVIGAAAGTTISLLLANGLIMNIYYSRKIKLKIGVFWKNIITLIPALIPSSIFGTIVLVYFSETSLLIFFVFIVIYIIIYCISMWFLGFNKYEKDLIKNISKKIIRRKS